MMTEVEVAIVFREVTDHLPFFPDNELQNRAYCEDQWFYVELHARGFCRPVAFATIGMHDGGGAMLFGLIVQDPFRRQGLGRAVIEAAGARWPCLSWSDAIESRSVRLQIHFDQTFGRFLSELASPICYKNTPRKMTCRRSSAGGDQET
jgi:GNAT superfamily N-acetyltransferase